MSKELFANRSNAPVISLVSLVAAAQAGQPLLGAEHVADEREPQGAAAPRSVYLETYGCQMNVADSEVRLTTPSRVTGRFAASTAASQIPGVDVWYRFGGHEPGGC